MTTSSTHTNEQSCRCYQRAWGDTVITFSNCVGVLSGSARKRFFLAAEISRDLSAVHGDTRRKRQSHGYQLGVRELQTCTFENTGQNSKRAEFNTTIAICRTERQMSGHPLWVARKTSGPLGPVPFLLHIGIGTEARKCQCLLVVSAS